jgi:hypothetical protein
MLSTTWSMMKIITAIITEANITIQALLINCVFVGQEVL